MPEESLENLEPGTLVSYRIGPDTRIGRIGEKCPCSQEGCEAYYLTSSYRILRSNIERVFSTPFDAIEHYDVTSRAVSARELLDRSIVKLSGNYAKADTYSAVRKLRDELVYTPHWFWQWVAIAKENPRQFSYSWEPEFVDVNKRRKRSSISALLKSATHKGLCSFTPEEIELIANAVGTMFPATLDYRFEVVRGEEVGYGYKDSPRGFESCMSKHWDTYVRWFTDNPETVGLLRVYQGEDYVARALVWNTLEGPVCLDRLYPAGNTGLMDAVRTYAESQGWLVKDRMDCGALTYDGGYYSVRMKPAQFGYPYMDTFRSTNDDPNGPEPLTVNMGDGEVDFCCTDGTWEGRYSEPTETCESCGCSMPEDEAHYVEDMGFYCQSCYDENWVYLDYRHGGRWHSGDYRSEDTVNCHGCCAPRLYEHTTEVEGDPYCEGCFENLVGSCDKCEDYVLKDNLVPHDDHVYCSDCFADIPACVVCGEKETSDGLTEIDGDAYCHSCEPCEDNIDCVCRACRAVPVGQLTLPNPEEVTNDSPEIIMLPS